MCVCVCVCVCVCAGRCVCTTSLSFGRNPFIAVEAEPNIQSIYVSSLLCVEADNIQSIYVSSLLCISLHTGAKNSAVRPHSDAAIICFSCSVIIVPSFCFIPRFIYSVHFGCSGSWALGKAHMCFIRSQTFGQ